MSKRYGGGEKYPVGSKWLTKKTDIFDKGTKVEIVDNGEPGKGREVVVCDDLGRNKLISVKDLWRRIK